VVATKMMFPWVEAPGFTGCGKIRLVSRHDYRAVRGDKSCGVSTRRFPPCNLQKLKILTSNVCHSEHPTRVAG